MNKDTKILKICSVITAIIAFIVTVYYLTFAYCEIAIVGTATLCAGGFVICLCFSLFEYAKDIERRRNGTRKKF